MPEQSTFVKPSIALAMIVRNGAQGISAALLSAKFVCSQIVVVDTGSTDDTPQIATRMGAEVYHCEWNNDFSQARNFALDHCRADWVLVLDADEVLDEQSLKDNLYLLADSATGGITVHIHNALSTDGFTSHTHSYTRLFRRDVHIRFEGRIHEQIANSIERLGLHIAQSSITIRHDGYSEPSPAKIKRNLELLQREFAENPDSHFIRYHLGLTEFAQGDLLQAGEHLGGVLNSEELSPTQNELARLRCAQIALANDDMIRVEQLLQDKCDEYHHEGLRQFILGAVMSIQLRWRDALNYFMSEPTSNSRLVNQEHRIKAIEGIRAVVRSQGGDTSGKSDYHRSSPDDLWTGGRLS
jgi:glycosyltransferase involved in cell wall biosynthesis